MSSKLRVEPSPDITFEVAGGKPNSCPLRLYNSGTEHTAFKVKTTAPKKYCVRPNAGVIPPGKHVEVHVIPQVVKGVDPTLANDLAGKCKDKFMIQSTTVQGDQAPSSELWAQVPQAELQQTLLRCKYKLASAGGDGVGGSIPEAGETAYATVKGFNIDELNFSDVDTLKARLSEANKEIQAQMVANARKVNELQQENAKLLAQKGADGGLRYKAPAAVSGTQGTGSGFTPLFLILATLIAYVMGVYTTLMTLPK